MPYTFDRFAQVDSSITREYQGTGIGLTLVKELTDLQDGKITVASRVKRGTIFNIEFLLLETNISNDEEAINN